MANVANRVHAGSGKPGKGWQGEGIAAPGLEVGETMTSFEYVESAIPDGMTIEQYKRQRPRSKTRRRRRLRLRRKPRR
jgi:hypothetical protein